MTYLRSLCSLVLLMLLSVSACQAGPRLTGRLQQVQSTKRLVVIARSDGRQIRGLVRKDAALKRLGAEVSLGAFRAGDYVVVEVAGPLNDTPLDVSALMDVHTAGAAPTAQGSGFTNTSYGTFATVGGPGAPLPYTQAAAGTSVVALGGAQNAPLVGNYTMAGAPAAHHERDEHVTVGAYGPTEATAGGTIQIPRAPTTSPTSATLPQSQTFTAAPAPAGSPYTAQVLAQQSPPRPYAPANATTPQPGQAGYGMQPGGPLPTAQGAHPATQYVGGHEEEAAGGGFQVQGASHIPSIVSVQGTVTQVTPQQRLLTMQANQAGRPYLLQVVVPPPVPLMDARGQQAVSFEGLRVGDYVMVTGIMSAGGTVEARKLYVNH